VLDKHKKEAFEVLKNTQCLILPPLPDAAPATQDDDKKKKELDVIWEL
jgi:hypothetical protein